MPKTLIIGGVAGGATAAARLRRLDEQMEIVLIERGDNISYANCGLPYYIGDVIRSRQALLVQTVQAMRDKFNIDVRTAQEAVQIMPGEKKVRIRKREGEEYLETYDELVLATGSSPLRPPIPGIDLEGIHTLWTVEDTDRIRGIVDEDRPETAAVIGGGFIGLEMAENLHRRGIRVSIIEAQDQVMAPVDFEMAQLLHANMWANGVALHLGDGVKAFSREKGQLQVELSSGACVKADLVILSIGVRPNSLLAREAGLELNARGGIVVDKYQRTSADSIWAVGDVIQIVNRATGEKGMIPLAGPANKQGRIAADNIAAKYRKEKGTASDTVPEKSLSTEYPGSPEKVLPSEYHGSLGTSIAQVFDFAVGSVGVNEKILRAGGLVKGRDYETVLIAQKSHAGYYPLATELYLKLIFDKSGKIYGAQIVGQKGVDKRIDTIAVTMRLGGTVHDLTEMELAYAPPFSSAKDPVNMAGFTAENVLRGLVKFRTAEEFRRGAEDGSLYILDIREDVEHSVWMIPGSKHIPLGELRSRLEELPRDREICVFCAVGVRSYNAARILSGSGFDNVSVLEAGSSFYRMITEMPGNAPEGDDGGEKMTTSGEIPAGEKKRISGEKTELRESEKEKKAPVAQGKFHNLDCSGMQCPGPIMKVNEMMKEMEDGDLLRVAATDMGFARDVETWCARTGNTFVSSGKKGVQYFATLRKGTEASSEEESVGTGSGEAAPATAGQLPQGKTLIVFDGDFDKALAAFIIANGAAAMGRPVTMFFTFWGLNILRKSKKVKVPKTIVEKMFGTMMPRGTEKLQLSKMNMGGMGTKMMKMVMKQKNVNTLEDLIRSAMYNGVRIVACTMSMDVMGIKKEELIDGIEYAGVASYLGDAEQSNVNLFI